MTLYLKFLDLVGHKNPIDGRYDEHHNGHARQASHSNGGPQHDRGQYGKQGKGEYVGEVHWHILKSLGIHCYQVDYLAS